MVDYLIFGEIADLTGMIIFWLILLGVLSLLLGGAGGKNNEVGKIYAQVGLASLLLALGAAIFGIIASFIYLIAIVVCLLYVLLQGVLIAIR